LVAKTNQARNLQRESDLLRSVGVPPPTAKKDQPSGKGKLNKKAKLVGRKDQPSVEELPTVIVEIWLGTSGRKLSAISFIQQSDATNRKKTDYGSEPAMTINLSFMTN